MMMEWRHEDRQVHTKTYEIGIIDVRVFGKNIQKSKINSN